jgi:predicted ATPase
MLTSLIGREREIEAIGTLLHDDQIRMVTLIGPGGVGKTRLAIAAATKHADAFADGAWFVSLAPIVDPHVVCA